MDTLVEELLANKLKPSWHIQFPESNRFLTYGEYMKETTLSMKDKPAMLDLMHGIAFCKKYIQTNRNLNLEIQVRLMNLEILKENNEEKINIKMQFDFDEIENMKVNSGFYMNYVTLP